jgi:hypothetical protein
VPVGGRTWLGLVSLLAAGLALPATASAGTYVVWQCKPPDRTQAHTAGPWYAYSENNAPRAAADNCTGAAGSFVVTSTAGSLPYSSPNSGVGLVAQSFGPITIQHLRLWGRAVLGSGSPSNDAFHVAQGVPFRLLEYDISDSASKPSVIDFRSGRDFALDPTTVDVRTYILCQVGNMPSCPGDASITITGAEMTLAESEAPAISSTVPSSASGRLAVPFRASDGGSGVRRVALLVDGTEVDAQDLSAGCTYTGFAACLGATAGELDVDTDGLSNGSHQVGLRVEDAAGNRTDKALGAVAVTNGRTGPNGTNASDDARMSLRFAGRRGRVATVPFGHGGRLGGRLRTAGGQPIGGAELRVLIRTLRSGEPYVDRGALTTRADGRFGITLPRGPARRVRIAYRSRFDAPQFAATATATLLARASLTLHARPHSLRNGQTARFSGRLRGGPIPGGGKVVELQALDGGRWRTFTSVRSDARGHYRASYRFRNTFSARRFRFRARSRRDASYPYTLGYSRRVVIRVRP